MRLDARSTFPKGMEEYLQYYGWHFSKRMEEWAASKMYKEINGKRSMVVNDIATVGEAVKVLRSIDDK